MNNFYENSLSRTENFLTSLDTSTGARAVPALSTSLGRGILDNSRVFTPDKPLRTGTVRGPAVVYPDAPGFGRTTSECSPSRPLFDMFCPDMSQTVASPREKCALLADYQPVSGAFDELFTATGELRAHFIPLVRDLDRLGPAELRRRADTVRRLIHEQGITYNV